MTTVLKYNKYCKLMKGMSHLMRSNLIIVRRDEPAETNNATQGE
jgi:hypothetical protein